MGPVEAVLIVVVVLAVFGAGRLAGVGKALGTDLREFRQEAPQPVAGAQDARDESV
ncbi:MAG: twin-arginine translocase TatA/TatE family subunit [Dehalococcoidia bacterium]